MTGSWDQTLKFWDTRSPNPMLVLQLPERVYCADVVYPMAIVGTAQRGIICYQLENQPSEYKRIESPLKYQVWNSYVLCHFKYGICAWCIQCYEVEFGKTQFWGWDRLRRGFLKFAERDEEREEGEERVQWEKIAKNIISIIFPI